MTDQIASVRAKLETLSKAELIEELIGALVKAADIATARPPGVAQAGREVSDERALDLARRILDGQFTTEDAACEIMIYATDCVEQEKDYPAWQPIDTAPVEPWDKVPSYYRFNCLLQIQPGHPNNPPTVCAGYAYYVAAPRSKENRILRWSDGHHQCRPALWQPLPAPSVSSTEEKSHDSE